MTELRVTLACGMSRMGKTTFLLRYLVAEKRLSCRFIFDPLGLMAQSMGLVCAELPEECAAAVADGFVCFDPATMFPGNNKAGLEWFARWAYDTARQMGGRKVLLVDEVWKYQTSQTVPQPLAEWIQDGAKFGMECLFAIQQPNKLNSAITGQITELVCFRLQEKNGLDVIESLGAPRAEVQGLPKGEFLSLNLLSGGRLRGRVF